MRLDRRIPVLLLAGMFVLSLFAIAGTASAEAGPPEWEEGDSWAMGFSVDIGAEFADILDDLEDMVGEIPGFELDEFDVDGEMAFWLVFEVTEETSTHYTLTGSMGQQLVLSVAIEVTGQMPDASTKTISVDASLEYAMVMTAEAILEKDTLAVESISIHVLASAILDIDAKNIPMWNDDDDTLSFENLDVKVLLNLDLQVDMEFNPALDIFDFPINVDDVWIVESTMTVSGTIDGLLDIRGLPADIEQDMLSEDIFVNSGITSFPIHFDQLSVDEDDGPSIHDGVIDEVEVDIMLALACTGTTNITHPTAGEVTAYKIQIEDGPEFLYSPDVKFMTSMGADMGFLDMMGIDLPFDLPSEMMDIQMGSVDSAEAKGQIESIANFQSSLAGETQNGNGDGLSSFFFSPPYFGVIIIVLVVFIVIAAVFAVTKRK